MVLPSFPLPAPCAGFSRPKHLGPIPRLLVSRNSFTSAAGRGHHAGPRRKGRQDEQGRERALNGIASLGRSRDDGLICLDV